MSCINTVVDIREKDIFANKNSASVIFQFYTNMLSRQKQNYWGSVISDDFQNRMNEDAALLFSTGAKLLKE